MNNKEENLLRDDQLCRKCGAAVIVVKRVEVLTTKYFKKVIIYNVGLKCTNCKKVYMLGSCKRVKKNKEALTEDFIKFYLKKVPKNYFRNKYACKYYEENKNYRKLCKLYKECNGGKITKLLKIMRYEEFLETRYWKIVSNYIKRERRNCFLCGSKEELCVHHNNYFIRGEEHLKMKKGLVVMCKKCHEKHHNIVTCFL